MRNPSSAAPTTNATRVGPQLAPSTAHRARVTHREVDRHVRPLGRLPGSQRDLRLLHRVVIGVDSPKEHLPHTRHKCRDRRKADFDLVAWERNAV